ncbi:MAG TPA: DUF5916 domain-containing protein [Longimicrobiales bacterium]
MDDPVGTVPRTAWLGSARAIAGRMEPGRRTRIHPSVGVGVLAFLLAGAGSGGAQTRSTTADCWAAPDADGAVAVRTRAALGRRVAVAARVPGAAPTIDGRLEERAWCVGAPLTDLVQSAPSPGELATLPTVARVLYDGEAVYVGVRLFDPHPDSIVAPYPRRDDETTSDWVFVELDPRFDRRSGYSFGVNPRGVEADGSWSDDVDYNTAWNGVWGAAARIDGQGWTAEFRIPYSQLGLGQRETGSALVWGINIYRYTPHRGETSNWSPRLPSVVGVISHFNELHGVVVPDGGVGIEVTPYSAVTATRSPSPGDGGAMREDLSPAAGVDARLRTSTVDAALSIRPDFGQVEADPSQINLTTFETFFPEQRPLFVEGTDVFRFNSALDFSTRGTSFAEESPFYSRRIGRPPAGSCPAGATDCRKPNATTVLGAVRVSGHTADGWTGGLFHAWTGAEHAAFVDGAGAAGRVEVEPLTRFTVVRAERSRADGRAAVGVMGTLVGRSGMTDGVDSLLAHRALVVGADARARFAHDAYEVTGFALASRVEGTPSMIRALRREPRHGYHDPGGDVAPTSLSGYAAQARVARVDGRLQWGIALRAISQGFEANDLGFQRNANWLLAVADWRYLAYRPGRFIRRWSVGSRQLGIGWTLAGERRAAVANLTASVDLRNYWGASLSLDHEFAVRDPEVLRGGPAFLLPGRDLWTAEVYSDTRRRWQFSITASGVRESATHSHEERISPSLSAFVTDRLQVGITPLVGSTREAWQYVAQPRDAAGRTHYLLGDLHQTTASLTTRATYAFSAHLTLQLYAELFLSSGRYETFRDVVAPVAPRASDRAIPITSARLGYDPARRVYVVDDGAPSRFTFADPAFSERDGHVNMLVRWEFRPGSTLFLVWTQERIDHYLADFDLGRDLHRLSRAPGANALLLKVSYWFPL